MVLVALPIRNEGEAMKKRKWLRQQRFRSERMKQAMATLADALTPIVAKKMEANYMAICFPKITAAGGV